MSGVRSGEGVVGDWESGTMTAQTPSAPAVDAEQTIRRVGGRIRHLRSAQALTLQDVADRTGVSVSMLSMLERGVAGASIGTLVAVSSALGVHMSDLFESGVDEPSPVRRRSDQTQVETAAGVLRRLVHHAAAEGLEMVVNEYAPGTSSGPDAVHHPGREFGIVLEGTLLIELEGVRYEVGAGDAVSYASTRPHRISNHGSGTARAVWVNLDAPRR